MRHGRLTAIAAAALLAMAIAPAWAAADPSTFTDDTLADFTAGSADANTSVSAPGTVALKPTFSDDFNGSLDSSKWSTPMGPPSIGGGFLTLDGTEIDANEQFTAPTTMEFIAKFGGDHAEHIGLGADLIDGPWALFSTFGGQGIYARTLTADGHQKDEHVADPDGQFHTYDIERTANAVTYSIDGHQVASHDLTASPLTPITAPMGAVASDAGGTPVNIDSLSVVPATGTFVSRVFDAGDARTIWGNLSSDGSGVSFQTRTGDTSVPDGTWSAWQDADSGSGAIASPKGQHIQYEATFSGQGSSLNSVTIPYEVDKVAPDVTLDDIPVSGTTATATFHSTATDVDHFECSVDGGAFTTCTSPDALTNVAVGSHAFDVRAIDNVGNTSAAAEKSFSIASPPPANNGGGTSSGTSGGSAGGTSGTSGQQTSNNNNSNGNGSTGNSSVDRTAPKVALRSTSLHLSKHGTVSVKLKCPAGEQRCRVTLQLMRGKSVVGHKTVTIKGGKTATISVQLTKAIRRQLAGHRKVKLTAAIKATDAAGNVKKTKRTVTVRG